MNSETDNLVEAATQGDFHTVRRLLSTGAYLEAVRDTALIVAAQGGHHKIVQELLGHYAYQQNERDWALLCAVRGAHANTVRVLLEAGAVLTGHLPAWVADKKNAETIRLLQEHNKGV